MSTSWTVPGAPPITNPSLTSNGVKVPVVGLIGWNEIGDALERDDLLTRRIGRRLEPLDLAIREGDADDVRLRRDDAVIRKDSSGPCLLPVVPQDAIPAGPQRLHVERPADAELARALVAAVVDAIDRDRNALDRAPPDRGTRDGSCRTVC